MQTKTLKIIFTAISIGLMLPATNAFAIQADDGTAHHAIIYSGMGINNILFSTDGSIGHIDHGTIVGSNRIVTAGTNTGAVTIAIDNNYDGTLTDITAGNVAHTDVSDTYTVKDSDSYCWDVTYYSSSTAYIDVEETTDATYAAACANVAVQAADGTSHYANLDSTGVQFSTTGYFGIKDNGDILDNITATNVTFDNAGVFNNNEHISDDGTYTVKDSDSYCWDVTYSMGTYAYTAVVETAKTAGDNVLYGTACANVTPAAVQAPFASYLAIPFLFAAFTGIGFIANTRKKT